MPDEIRRESPAGYHVYSTYHGCPRKFFFRYCLGWQPEQRSAALLFGAAMHEAQEVYYLNDYNIDLALEKLQSELITAMPEYESEEDYLKDLEEGPIMLKEWHRTWEAHDRETYEIIGTEVPYEFHIGPEAEFVFTVRLDVIFRDKFSGRYIVKDLKTTRWSDIGTFKSVDSEDQMTSYLWALSKVHPEWSVECAIPDILYKRSSMVKATRPGEIYRSKYALALFEAGMFGTIAEVSQKVKSLGEHPAEVLFPRNGSQCAKFGCEYFDICRNRADPTRPPVGFKQDTWTGIEELKKINQMEDLEKWKVL